MASGGAWLGETPGGVDETGDVAVRRRGFDERVDRLPRGHVDGGGAHVEPGVAHHVGSGVGVRLAQVGQHDMLAGADAPGDRLSDRSRSDDDDERRS
jgi:hypothetical protein